MKVKRNITTESKSVIKKLKDQNKINDSNLICINNISIEDLIAVKFELSAKHINNRLYGFDIWHRSNYIIKEAILKFAISATKSKKDAARFLGLTYGEFKRITSKYEVENYFTNGV
jgi:methionyl-tRNA formyltransferase